MRRLLTTLTVVALLLTWDASVAYAAYPNPGTGKSNIYVQNVGPGDSTITVTFTTGETGGEAGSVNLGTVIPKGQKIIYSGAIPVAAGWAGAAEIQSPQPTAAVVAVLWDRGTVRAAGSYVGVDAPDTQCYLPFLVLRDTAQISRVTVQNTDAVVAPVTIHWYSRSGVEDTAKTVVATIPPKSEKTWDLGVVQPNFSDAGGYGSAFITSTVNIAAVASVHWGPAQYNSSDIYQGVSHGDTILWAPGIFRFLSSGCGDAGSTQCYSNYNVLNVQNVGTAPALITLEFWKDDGSLTHVMTETIQANSSKAFNTAIAASQDPAKFNAMAAALGTHWRGTIKIISDGQPIAATCTYFCRNSGVMDCLINVAIRESDAVADKALASPAAYRKRNQGSANMYTTTLVQNLSDVAGTLTVDFFNSDTGQMVPRTWPDVPIPARGQVGLNLKVTVNLSQAALDALGTNFTGAMYVTPSPGLRLIAVNNWFWDGAGRAAAYSCPRAP